MRRRQLGENPLAFKTLSGSRLYGLDHEGSDIDYVFVHTQKMRATSIKVEGADVNHLSLFDLLEKAYRGVPMAVEAVFSQQKVWYDTTYISLFESARVPVAAARPTYIKLINQAADEDTEKSRQRAVRLAINLRTLDLFDGWMNPTLNPGQIRTVQTIATTLRGQPLLDKLEEIISE